MHDIKCLYLNMIKLEDKLYTSTEVAVILGVSLRSVYRYIEENKLNPEVKTATGRHRFTKQNIIDFLYPNGIAENNNLRESVEVARPTPAPKKIEADKVQFKKPVIREEVEDEVEIEPEVPAEKKTVAEPVVKDPESEPIDWLAKFREAAKKFEEEPEKEKFTGLTDVEVEVKPRENKFYYRSKLGGLKDIAQNIDKTSKNSGLEYAFSVNAGLSLHSPIKPFSLLHSYVRSKDKDFFEKVLMLTPSDMDNAQLCLIVSDDNQVYKSSQVMHGLMVVSNQKLLSDIREMDTEGSLLKEAENILG